MAEKPKPQKAEKPEKSGTKAKAAAGLKKPGKRGK
jgi:hypothetical protein